MTWSKKSNIKGAKGDAGSTVAPGTPSSRTLAFGTTYQATDKTKPALISVMLDTAYSITLAGTSADTVELRIGSSATGLSDGTAGFAVASFRSSLTGIALTIGMGSGDRGQLIAMLPPNWYFCVRRVAGTQATIAAAFDQPMG